MIGHIRSGLLPSHSFAHVPRPILKAIQAVGDPSRNVRHTTPRALKSMPLECDMAASKACESALSGISWLVANAGPGVEPLRETAPSRGIGHGMGDPALPLHESSFHCGSTNVTQF